MLTVAIIGRHGSAVGRQTIRNPDVRLKARFRMRSDRHGGSMEEAARVALDLEERGVDIIDPWRP